MTNKSLTPFSFPIWWYSEGLQLASRRAGERYRYVMRSTGIAIFMRNMMQPLYGDYTRAGRIISFFLRIVLLVGLFVWTVLRLGFVGFMFVLHIIALPLTIVMIVYQLFSLFI